QASHTWGSIGLNRYSRALHTAFCSGVKYYFDKTLVSRLHRSFGPIRTGTSAGRLNVGDNQGSLAHIGKFKFMLNDLAFSDGAKIVLYVIKFKLRHGAGIDRRHILGIGRN